MNGWIIDEQAQVTGQRYELPEEAAACVDEPMDEGLDEGLDERLDEGLDENMRSGQEADEKAFVLLRPLTDAEALARESVGIVEWYYLDGREPAVRRTYDLAAMTEYDYRHCVLDFRLPVQDDGQVRLVAMERQAADDNLRLLGQMPPKLAAWMAECIADVNMRSREGRRRLEAAKKN